MREVKTSRLFRKHYKKLKKSGRRDMRKLQAIMTMLAEGKRLLENNLDHELAGEWQGYRECHIEGDWLLIYKLEGDKSIIFVASDTHANLFE